MGKDVYVFGGYNEVTGFINSIERLDAFQVLHNWGADAQWQVIEIPANVLSTRSVSLFAPIGPNQLLILGGQETDGGFLGDGYVFDARRKVARRCVDTNNFKLSCESN